MDFGRLNREASLENILRYVAAYGAPASLGHRFEEVEFRILQAFKGTGLAKLDFWTIHKILGVDFGQGGSELAMAKIAWTLQHEFDARAWCVGYKLVQMAQDRFFSRVVEQISELGLESRSIDLAKYYHYLDNRTAFSRIDTVLIDPVSRVIRPVKGCTFSTLKKFNRVLKDGRMTSPTLFDAADRIVSDVCIPSKYTGTLEVARRVLSDSFVGVEVRPLFVIVDDVESGWHYQIHELPDRVSRIGVSSLVRLEDLPLVTSSIKYREDPDALDAIEQLPRFAVTSPLSALPVNRAARAHMEMDVLWRRQASEHGLAFATYAELSKDMRDRYMVVYPHDLQRHDMQDCLLKGPTSLVRQGERERGRRFALTDVGVFQTLFIRKLMSEAGLRSADDLELDEAVLNPIRRQARLWRDYDEGSSVY